MWEGVCGGVGVMSYQLAPSNQFQFEVSRMHDDIILIVVGEGECVMAKKFERGRISHLY